MLFEHGFQPCPCVVFGEELPRAASGLRIVGGWKRRRRRVGLGENSSRRLIDDVSRVGSEHGVAEGSDGLGPVLGQHGKSPVDCGEEFAVIDVTDPVGRGDQRVAHDAIRGRWRAVAGDGAVKGGAKGIEVRPRALHVAFAGILFKRRITVGDDAGHAAAALAEGRAGGPEVEQHRRSVAADEDVVRLDVPVQQVRSVDSLESVEERPQGVGDSVLDQGPLALQLRAQAFAFLEGHHHVGGPLGLEEAFDANDVGMILEGDQAPCLVEEAFEAPGEELPRGLAARRHRQVGATRGDVEGQVLLDCQGFAQHLVGRQIGDAETALAEDALDPVILQAVAAWQGVRVSFAHADRDGPVPDFGGRAITAPPFAARSSPYRSAATGRSAITSMNGIVKLTRRRGERDA